MLEHSQNLRDRSRDACLACAVSGAHTGARRSKRLAPAVCFAAVNRDLQTSLMGRGAPITLALRRSRKLSSSDRAPALLPSGDASQTAAAYHRPTPSGDAMADETIRFDDGASYELMMGRWSLLVGERFLDW